MIAAQRRRPRSDRHRYIDGFDLTEAGLIVLNLGDTAAGDVTFTPERT